MRKLVLTLVGLCSFSSIASAAADSVGVFHRDEKVVVLINEHKYGRLQDMMNFFGAGRDLLLQSSDESIRINCGRNTEAATCTIRMLPSSLVKIANKSVAAATTLQDLKVSAAGDFEISFESSREDKFTLIVEDSVLYMKASKRLSVPADKF